MAGAIATGRGVLAAEVLGADFAYMGTRFIASEEANAPDRYKRMVVECQAADIVYTPTFTGVHGNYLRPSIAAALMAKTSSVRCATPRQALSTRACASS